MKLSVLADENVDHRVVHRLDNYGHDVEHVDTVPSLGKGCPDARIAKYSLESDRAILSSDDDFLSDFERDRYSGLLFVEDESLRPATIADIVHAMSTALDSRPDAVYYVSRNWL